MKRLLLRALVRAATVLFALIVYLYPSAFRERCGRAMLETFEQSCASHVQRGNLAAFCGTGRPRPSTRSGRFGRAIVPSGCCRR